MRLSVAAVMLLTLGSAAPARAEPEKVPRRVLAGWLVETTDQLAHEKARLFRAEKRLAELKAQYAREGPGWAVPIKHYWALVESKFARLQPDTLIPAQADFKKAADAAKALMDKIGDTADAAGEAARELWKLEEKLKELQSELIVTP